MDQLLEECVRRRASDVHLRVGSPPVFRVDGHLQRLGEHSLGTGALETLCRSMCSNLQWDELTSAGTTDLGLVGPTGERFRANVMRERGGYAAAIRRVDRDIMSFAQIGIDETVITPLLTRKRGLILVTGPTGSGKSTTLATFIDWINCHEDRHIVTIEDPVEKVHVPKKGLVTQREVGIDVSDFSEAMRRVVRQDPDVIMVGEMRDLATMSAALTAAETGHLVLATLHTTGAAQTVGRIIDVFPADQQAQIRVQLSASLLAVISQALVPTRVSGGAAPGRRAALEVMIRTPAVANLIRTGDPQRIEDVIQTSRAAGMQTLDSHLLRLAKEQEISRETALAFARDPQGLEQQLFR